MYHLYDSHEYIFKLAMISGTATELQIAAALPEILERLPGWSAVVVKRLSDQTDLLVSAEVENVRIEFGVDVRSGAWRPDSPGPKPKIQLDRKPWPVVLATACWRPKVARSLREANQNYLDTAGNIFLRLPGLYVFRETSDPPLVDIGRDRSIGETFAPTTTRVGLQLLLEPELVNASYRELARRSGISLRSVQLAMEAFKADGFVEDARKKQLRLVSRTKFFTKWVEGYNRRLRPKLRLGRYRMSDPEGELVLDEHKACWGGEQASMLIGNGVHSVERLVHVYGTATPIIAKNKLRLDPDGSIELMTAVWDPNQEAKAGIAPLFVVYADLVNTRDPRCEEVANRMWEDLLQRTLDD
jgi:hypothetical protein